MDQRLSLETSHDLEALAADGMEQTVDDRTLFCTPAPLAASTVARDMNRAKQQMMAESKGSFLDDMSRLSLQPMSAADITNQLMQLTFSHNIGDASLAAKSPVGEQGPNLIQFSASAVSVDDQGGGGSEQDISKSDSLTDVSSRSSMGLISTDMLNELSASVLPLNTPKAAPPQTHTVRQKTDSTATSYIGKSGDSTEWSVSDNSKKESKHSTPDNSQHDSKQDSKDLPMGRSHLDTVKKKPLTPDSQFTARPLGGLRGGVALFSGGMLDNVQEGNELDHSICDVELGAEELRQLDASFSDLEGDKSSVEDGAESGDEDFGFDEDPLFSLPARAQRRRSCAASVTDSHSQNPSESTGDVSDVNDQAYGDQEKTLEADRLEEGEGRLGEGQESDEEDGGSSKAVSSKTGFGLDSCYFRKTPQSFSGDGEDTEVARSDGALTLSMLSQQRGAAEGEHLLTKLRRQFMSGDGSETDTDDELEAARKSLSLAKRPQSQGADSGDGSRNNLPLPVGLEDDERSGSDSKNYTEQSQSQCQFSYLTRQSGEGDAAYSPLPWDGGGGGDGSSGPDSDDGGQIARQGKDQAAPRHFAVPRSQASISQMPISAVPGLSESGLQPDFFLPSSAPLTLQDSELGATHALEGSTFQVEDILKPSGNLAAASGREARLDASGFNADDNKGNPFEKELAGMQSSFGSFGLEPGEKNRNGASISSPRCDQMKENVPVDSGDIRPFPTAVSASHKSGSFDGPFRKPRAPPEKKVKKKELVEAPATQTSNSSGQWKNLGFPDMDGEGDNLEKELQELGISFGDDDFQAAESAQAMLAADEKQFEDDNKFSEHHHLVLATEGLSWDMEEDQLSGYLCGEDRPEHLEVSIGTYIAARTEALGTLSGDPHIPRPEFGKPVRSPPHRNPVKLVSPPASASTSYLSLPSRTEGEGNEDEDGDQTFVSEDSAMNGNGLNSSPMSQAHTSADKAEKNAETTLREELSSLILDLTNTSSWDMSMEDALSMSTVLNFVKNHNFMKSSDFASAILKLSHVKKQQEADRRRSMKAKETGAADECKQVRLKTVQTAESQSKDMGEKKEPAGRSESQASPYSVDSCVVSPTSNTSASITSPQQKSSRLPVRLGSNVTGSAEERRARTLSGQARDQLAPGRLSKSHSVSQLPSQVKLYEETEEGSRKGQKDRRRTILDDGQSAARIKQTARFEESVTFEVEENRGPQIKSRLLQNQDAEENSQRQNTSTARKTISHDRDLAQEGKLYKSASVSHQDCHGDSEKANKHQSLGLSSLQGKASQKQEVSTEKPTSAPNTMPLNIPLSAPKQRRSGMQRLSDSSNESMAQNERYYGMDRYSSQASFRVGHKSRCNGDSYLPTFQTPAMKLPPSSSSQGQREHPLLQNPSTAQSGTPSNQGSPRSAKYNHHVPDGMTNSSSAAHHRGDDLCVSREEAVGTEDVELMESRQFNLVDDVPSQAKENQLSAGNVSQAAGEQKRSQALPTSSAHSASRDSSAQFVQKGLGAIDKPALLMGTSLLKTEFAQKFLTSGHQNRSVEQQQSFQKPSSHGSNGQLYRNQQGSRQPPGTEQHGARPPTNRQTPRQPQTSENYNVPLPANHSQSLIDHNGYRPQAPANTTSPGLDETAMSVYYELNEDLQQTGMLGDHPESSVYGSFWGKSPLYQSTPATEMGKVPFVTMMASRLDERELTAPGTNLVTPRIQRQLIDVQRKVIFPEFCCLGVSQKTSFPITNRTAVGVSCRFHLAQLQHSGKPTNPELQSPFEIKPKLSIGPGSTEDLPVLFVPKRPGEHVAHVEVFAQSLSPTLEPTTTVVQIHAVAEVPNIQIAPSVEVLDYGDVMWGACLSKTIKLRNLKHASLPVRLTVWLTSTVWHCFTFDSSGNTSDMSIISMSNRPESLGRNVFTVILPGCENETDARVVEIQLYCRPPVKELNRALAERPADKIEARVDVEVDTPVQYLPPLASLTVRATVGAPRLQIPPSHMSLSFKTQPNKNIQESVILNNSGNISMDLALSVTTFPECFTVSPARVTIKPGCQADISVIFSPLESGVYKYQSLLLLDIEPEGPSYEIPMEAHVARPAPPTRVTSPSILTSKSFLSFPGVALNQTKSLTLRLFNKDCYKAEYATVEVRGATDCFKLVTVSGEWQQKCEVVLDPKEKVSLTVIFCPTAIRGYSGKLVVKMQDSHSTKYSIPLSGYGGRSVLTLSGACLTNSGQRWLELGPLKVAHNIMREVVLTNSGVRAAFVRAAAFYDMPCKQAVHPGRVAVEPNNFVLPPGNSLKVVVAISPSQREVDLVKERKEVVAVVRFQHGDEVMRQKYQRSLARDGSKVELHSWQAAFSQQFANEAQDTVIQEGRTVPDSPDDSAAFFHHLSSQCVALLADPQPEKPVPAVSSSSAPYTHQSSQSSSPTSSVHSREEKVFDLTGQFLIPARSDDADADWIVKPDHLSLTVGESNQKMLQLINFSRLPFRFELTWPPNSVVPEPQKGEMKPRSSTSIEVWLHMAWQKRQGELPWRGDLVISCNGEQKRVRVHIQNAPNTPVLAISSLRSSPSSVSTVSKRLSRDANLSTTRQSLQLASTNIHFSRAKVNDQHESVLELTNVSTEPVRWKLSAFAPPYVKGADESNTVQRVGYSVFTISPCTEDLLPQETVKVPVKFCPKTKGTYNQHWEVEYQPLTAGRAGAEVTATKISLTAEVSARESLPAVSMKQTPEPMLKEKEKAGRRTPLQEKQTNTVSNSEPARSTPQELLLLNPDVHFLDTKVGQATKVKVEFKNSHDHNVQLEVTAPKPPFKVKHMTFGITKRRFLKYPIEFRPTSSGNFEATMVFIAPELKKSFTVRLTGQGVG